MDELVQLELWRQLVVFVPLGIMLLVSAWTDFRHRKVYNKVTYPAFFVGVVAHGIAFGWAGLGWGLLAAVVMLVIGLFMLPFGWIGGGDVKLLTAAAAFLGLKGLAQLSFYSVLVGAAGGLLIALLNGYLWDMLARMFRYIRGWLRFLVYRTKEVREPLERDERSFIPFAISVFLGGVIAWVDAVYGWPGLWDIFARAFQT